jgi:hypothetical protein
MDCEIEKFKEMADAGSTPERVYLAAKAEGRTGWELMRTVTDVFQLSAEEMRQMLGRARQLEAEEGTGALAVSISRAGCDDPTE